MFKLFLQVLDSCLNILLLAVRIYISKTETSAENLMCILCIISEAGHITDSECD